MRGQLSPTAPPRLSWSAKSMPSEQPMIGWMPALAIFFGEFQRAEHVVGVGQRQRRLAVFFGELRQPRDGQRALEQRIGRMNVQMHEAGVGRHIDRDSRLAILRGASMRDRGRWSPSSRRASSPRRTESLPQRAAGSARPQMTPRTWAQTATIARNRVTDASAKASSATARTMCFSPSCCRTNREHSSLIVLESRGASGLL